MFTQPKLVEDGNVVLFTGEAPGGRKVAEALISGVGSSTGPELVEKLAHIIQTSTDKAFFSNAIFSKEAHALANEGNDEAQAWQKANPNGQEWKGAEAYSV